MLAQLTRADFGARLWRHDAALWSGDPAVQRAIAGRLGWLETIAPMHAAAPSMLGLAAELRAEKFAHVVVLGMGGSSLAPEVFAAVLGKQRGWPRLHVLDSTVPAAVHALERAAPPARSMYVVASKSGTTVETAAFMDYFLDRTARAAGAGHAGRHFIAVTDPGTELDQQARARGFRAVFTNAADIGGRYSALSFFGLVPAALIGWDIDQLLVRAAGFATRCRAAPNPALQLGAALGALAADGRDKLTLALSPALAPLGPWIEQLVAESSGKQGRGIVPVDGERLAPQRRYDTDRVFVAVEMAGEENATRDRALAALAAAGHPVIRWRVRHAADLGAEFLRWEIATAAACAVLGVNPFDEPNVSEAKDTTGTLLRQPQLDAGRLAAGDGVVSVYGEETGVAAGPADALNEFLRAARPGDYVALLAYLARDAATTRAMADVRDRVRARAARATTVGFGPRYLHSTGQLHKGGANNGLFLVLTGDVAEDAPVPGRDYSFSRLNSAQALGDLQTLRRRGRRALRVHLHGDPSAALSHLARLLARAA